MEVFFKTFPYIMATTSKTGKSLRLFRGVTQFPDNDGVFSTKTLKMSWSDTIKLIHRGLSKMFLDGYTLVGHPEVTATPILNQTITIIEPK